ncbi:hypothetical protein, partial [Providencia sp. PROV110]|uniref:hypothetical protein n=1 Tax=Providencia sp. PROV110 TaxID=2949821 RepID=UPI00234A6E89
MEFKGTPAPWAVDDNGVFFEITREDGLRVGDVCSSQHLYDDSKHHGNGVAYANACLIAAAPELLEALQKLVTEYKFTRSQLNGDTDEELEDVLCVINANKAI